MFEVYTTTDPKEYEAKVTEAFFGVEGFLIHRTTSPCGWTGEQPSANLGECAKRGIIIGRGHRPGGTIINMEGDITVAITKRGACEIAQQVIDKFVKYLKKRKISAEINHNDILVDGKKVVSWASSASPAGMTQQHIHFSVGPMDVELIQSVCTKTMYKIPGSLKDLGIDSDTIYTWMCKTLEEFN